MTLAKPMEAAVRRGFRFIHRTNVALIAAVWVLFAIGLVMASVFLDHDREQTVERALQQQRNVAALLEKHTHHIVAVASSVVDRMAERVAEHGMANVAGNRAEWEWLRRVSDSLPSVGILAIADRDGNNVLNSMTFGQPSVRVTDREYYRVHAAARVGLFIGEAQVGKVTGKSVFTVSRRLEGPDGEFQGVAVASIELNYFTDFLETLELGPGSAVSLLREDGAMIMRNPEGGAVGKRFPNAPILKLKETAPKGRYDGPSLIDAVERISVYSKVVDLPLVFVVGRPRDEIMQDWRRRAQWLAGGSLGFLLLLGVLTATAAAAIRRDRRSVAEVQRTLTALSVSNRKMQSVLNSVAEGICGVDARGNVGFLNPTAARLLGYDEAEVLGSNLHALCHHTRPDGSPYPDEECPVRRTLADGRSRRVDSDVFWRKDGSSFPVEFTAAAVHDSGAIVGGVVAFRDIGERLAFERTLREAKTAAEAANVAKSQFLANMSHEIRTPMNAVIGLIGLVAQTQLTEKQKGYVDKIRQAARSLLGLLNDILDFSTIDAGLLRLTQQPFRLDEQMDALATMVSMDAAGRRLGVDVRIAEGVPLDLIGDDVRLQQVLLNLVGNAIKFTERGGVTVRVEPVSVDDARAELRFSVRDSGIGLSEEQKRHLFEAFTQGDSSSTRRHGGTGLGLAISARLVALMGGRIGVESELGRGSCFTFSAVFGRGEAGSARARVPVPPRVRVLHVARDRTAAAAVTTRVLASLGWTVAETGSAADAVRELEHAALAGEPYGLVIVSTAADGSGDLDGIRHIRTAAPVDAAPLLFAAAPMAVNPLAAVECDGVLSIPILPTDLARAVTAALEDRQRRLPSPAKPPSRCLSGLRVLLAEDNVLSREVAGEILEREGAEVIAAANGHEVLDLLDGAGHFDLVLMDIQMPAMDGIEATRRLRARPNGRMLPVIAMTANATPEDRRRCLDAGMDEHLSKPLDADRLVAVVLRHCGRTVLRDLGGLSVARLPKPGGPPPEESLPDLPGVDAAAFQARTGSGGMLFLKLLGRFPQEHGDDVRLLKQMLARGDVGMAEHIAHTIKGLAGNLSANRLFHEADALTQAVRQGNRAPDLHAFEEAFEEVLRSGEQAAALAAGKRVAAHRRALDARALAALMAELDRVLERNDLAAEDIARRLLDGAPDRATEAATALLQAVERLNYAEARRCWHAVSERLQPALAVE